MTTPIRSRLVLDLADSKQVMRQLMGSHHMDDLPRRDDDDRPLMLGLILTCLRTVEAPASS